MESDDATATATATAAATTTTTTTTTGECISYWDQYQGLTTKIIPLQWLL
jgi:hypothetical protein